MEIIYGTIDKRVFVLGGRPMPSPGCRWIVIVHAILAWTVVHARCKDKVFRTPFFVEEQKSKNNKYLFSVVRFRVEDKLFRGVSIINNFFDQKIKKKLYRELENYKNYTKKLYKLYKMKFEFGFSIFQIPSSCSNSKEFNDFNNRIII